MYVINIEKHFIFDTHLIQNYIKMKTYLIAILTLISFFTMTACNDDDDNFVPYQIDSEIVLKGFLPGGLSPYHQVIYNQEDWVSLLTTMGYSENDIEVSIDFTAEQIIAAFYPGTTSSGTTVDLTSIAENENEIVVTTENLQIGTTADVAQPFEIVKIRKNNKPVVFEKI